MNLRTHQVITRTVFRGDRVQQLIHANLDQIEEGKEVDHKIVSSRFFGLAGAEVKSWSGEKEGFLGRYHGYDRPTGVESGVLENKGNYNGNGCGALSTVLTLQPGEAKEIAFVAGIERGCGGSEDLSGL